MTEFAANGLSGARIDEIAAKTHTSKRMIYYYFGDKEGLYRRVLEEAYRKVRAGEQELELDHLPPVEALRRLTEFTFDHHSRNPDFIRIVMIENIHHGAYMEQSELIRLLNAGAIQNLEAICRRGRAAGLFREDVSPLSCTGTSARRASSTSRTAPPFRAFSAARCTPPTGSARCEIIWSKWSSALRSNPSVRRDAARTTHRGLTARGPVDWGIVVVRATASDDSWATMAPRRRAVPAECPCPAERLRRCPRSDRAACPG